MDYPIVDAVLGLLIGAACLSIPQLVRIHRQRPDYTDTDAYLKQTGRSVQRIAQENATLLSRQKDDAQSARTAVHGVTP
ncbi:MAG TPA: hypothetical protein VMC83_42310 [Streptosporangiaceae bacterium]|nr:hypothetical protein [Streptosporangiaceae bacterium]